MTDKQKIKNRYTFTGNKDEWNQVAVKLRQLGSTKALEIISDKTIESSSKHNIENSSITNNGNTLSSEDVIESDVQVRTLKAKLSQKESALNSLSKRYEKLENDFNDARLIRNEKVTPLIYVDETHPEQFLENTKQKLKDTIIPIVQFSDWHVEEYVSSASVNGLNEYTTSIAEKRVKKLIDNLIIELEKHRSTYVVDTMIVHLGGDFIGGWIHSELEQTNTMSPIDAIRFAKKLLVYAIQRLEKESKIKNLIFLCNRGNHGRTTEKMQFANEAATNYETLLYEYLISEFKSNKDITFYVPDSGIGYFTIYNNNVGKEWTIRYFHGQQVQYGGGIGGLTIPLNKMIAKWDESKKANYNLLGHFHTLTYPTTKATVNGSLKGYDSYAFNKGLAFEKPVQSVQYYSLRDNTIIDRTFIICE